MQTFQKIINRSDTQRKRLRCASDIHKYSIFNFQFQSVRIRLMRYGNWPVSQLAQSQPKQVNPEPLNPWPRPGSHTNSIDLTFVSV